MAFELRALPKDHYLMWFSPDGSRLGVAMDGLSIWVWDTESGSLLRKLAPRHQSSIFRIAFSPDNTLLASGGDDNLALLWDTATGNCLAELVGHTDGVSGIDFSPDGGRLVSGSVNGMVRIWDCRDGSNFLDIQPPSGNAWNPSQVVWRTLFTPDGKRVVASIDQLVRIFDAQTGQLLSAWTGHPGPIFDLAMSRDGSRLATASDATVRIWETDTGTCLTELHHQTTETHLQVVMTPDASRVTTVAGSTVSIWDPRAGKCVLQIPIPVHPVRHRSSISPDGMKLATQVSRDTMRLWTLFEVVLSQMPDVPDEWRGISDATGALVFADWLEERNRFDEAERLRRLTSGIGSER